MSENNLLIQKDLSDFIYNIDLKVILVVEKNGLSFDYGANLFFRLNDVHKIILEALRYIDENTSKEFVNNIEKSIRQFKEYIDQIDKSKDQLWNSFDGIKDNVIRSVNHDIDLIFAGTDNWKLLMTFNFLRNDYFANNSESLVNSMFKKWSNWENDALNTLLGSIEEKVKQATDQAEQASASSEVLQEVKSLEWIKEIQTHQTEMTKLYVDERKSAFIWIISLSILFWTYLLGIKLWWFVDYNNFAKGGYYMYSQIVLGIVLISFLSYILKLYVDQFRLSSNILNNLRHKGTIINSYKLLFRTEGSEAEKIELNKLIIEKTTEHLFRLWDGTSFWKDDHTEVKILEKAIDALPKFR